MAATHSPIYDYTIQCPFPSDAPTSRNHLRFLKLIGGTEHNDITCELFISSAEEEKYEALSWCWGLEGASERIFILDRNRNHLTFLVSPNLAGALRSLRHESGHRLLWVDAICINQNDYEERSQQVPLMSEIYGQAESVCVWLGEGDPSSERAIKFLKDRVLELQFFDDLIIDSETAPEWMAVNKLMLNPWFSRRWVVQEIALASQATLHCGRDEITWEQFATAVSLFSHVESQNQAVSKIIMETPAYKHVPQFFANISELSATRLVDATSTLIRRSKVHEAPEAKTEIEPLHSLEYLVSTLSNFEATEPRDTIYALLAIARDTFPGTAKGESAQSFTFSPAIMSQLLSWGMKGIGSQVYHVDYKKPFFEVCKDFVIFAVRKSDGQSALDILCRPWAPDRPIVSNTGSTAVPVNLSRPPGGEPRKEKKMPSWIPRLSQDTRTYAKHDPSKQAGTSLKRLNADPLVGFPTTKFKPYAAAGARAVTKLLKFESGEFGEEDKKFDYESIFVEGFVLDRIGHLEERSQGGMIPSDWFTLGDWEDVTKPPPQEFWRTLVGDRGPKGENVLTFYTLACAYALRQNVDGGTINTGEIISHGDCSIVTDFVRRVQAVIWNRRLMRSQRGRYLGLVPRKAKEDDLICILYGCTVPVILRKIPKTPEQMQKQRDARYHADLVRSIKIVESHRRRTLKRRQEAHESVVLDENGHILQSPPQVQAPFPVFPPAPSTPVRRLTTKRKANTLPNEPTPAKKRRKGDVCHGCNRLLPAKQRRAAYDKSKPYKVAEPDEYYYEFIGECYVHGMMNGEAITVKGKSNDDQNGEEAMKSILFELR